MKALERVKFWLHSILTFALNAEWSGLCSGPLVPEVSPPRSDESEAGDLHSSSGHCEGKKLPLSPAGNRVIISGFTSA